MDRKQWARRSHRIAATIAEQIATALPRDLTISVHARDSYRDAPTSYPAPQRTPALDDAEPAPPLQLNLSKAVLPHRVKYLSHYLEMTPNAGETPITVIEILSPADTCPGSGRKQYNKRRIRHLESPINLVEIDLAPHGLPVPMSQYDVARAPGSEIIISPAQSRPLAQLWTVAPQIEEIEVEIPVGTDQPKITVRIPLRDR